MAIFYFIGAFLVIAYNFENLIPALVSIADDLFTGSSATGGFLGATVAFAFNRGVNRGLFSNEAGQGSAPIAHAAAKAHEPVSEGMVAILEPFIDTIIICLLTGLAVLSSGAWTDKFQNDFQDTDLLVLDSKYDETVPGDKEKLSNFMMGEETIGFYNGVLDVSAGEITNDLTIMHARSVAEDIVVSEPNGKFTGQLKVVNGKVVREGTKATISGKSLLHSAPLTNEAFKRSPLGEYGKYIVTIGLLLFAFSTAISWSYYGDRAVTYLFGAKAVIYYHVVYVIGFFLASFTDTTIIWTLSGITIALMTVPNLVGILLLRKDMKNTLKQYWIDFGKEYPDETISKRNSIK
jgi:AGCS family alanine or glycine:cation symporter